jgi:hypothetical protein
MNVFGTFAVFVLLFVIYQFLSTMYHYSKRKWREGFANKCECKSKDCLPSTCRCGNNCN